MDQKKYIGMDVHQASISVAVRNAAGKLISESIIETKAASIRSSEGYEAVCGSRSKKGPAPLGYTIC